MSSFSCGQSSYVGLRVGQEMGNGRHIAALVVRADESY